MQTLRKKFLLLLNRTTTEYVRNFHDTISWNNRLIAIVGARGIGKTTMVLQHIKLHEQRSFNIFVQFYVL